jgi:hypothetical protein
MEELIGITLIKMLDKHGRLIYSRWSASNPCFVTVNIQHYGFDVMFSRPVDDGTEKSMVGLVFTHEDDPYWKWIRFEFTDGNAIEFDLKDGPETMRHELQKYIGSEYLVTPVIEPAYDPCDEMDVL